MSNLANVLNFASAILFSFSLCSMEITSTDGSNKTATVTSSETDSHCPVCNKQPKYICGGCNKVFPCSAKCERKSDLKRLTCGRCKRVFYCSTQCQAVDWQQNHKNACTKNVHLIIGSSRRNLSPNTGWYPSIHGPEGDFTHARTFGGNAITVDLEQCDDPKAAHIIADAAQFDFSQYTIAKVFIERLPTQTGIPKEYTRKAVRETNLHDSVLRNLYPYLLPGATIEIEWSPYVNFAYETINKSYKRRKKTLAEGNPWQVWVDVLSAQEALSKIDPNQLNGDQDIYVDTLRTLANNDPTSAALLLRRLKLEINILLDLKKPHSQNNTGNAVKMVSLSKNGFTETFEEFERMNSAPRYTWISPHYFDMKAAPKSADVSKKLASIESSYFFEIKDYCGAFLTDFLGICGARENSKYIVGELTKLGFENVEINFTENPHNGRKNVMVVRANKPSATKQN